MAILTSSLQTCSLAMLQPTGKLLKRSWLWRWAPEWSPSMARLESTVKYQCVISSSPIWFLIPLPAARRKTVSRSLWKACCPKPGKFEALWKNSRRNTVRMMVPKSFLLSLCILTWSLFGDHHMCAQRQVPSPIGLPRCIEQLKKEIANLDGAYDGCQEVWSNGEAKGFFTELLLVWTGAAIISFTIENQESSICWKSFHWSSRLKTVPHLGHGFWGSMRQLRRRWRAWPWCEEPKSQMVHSNFHHRSF